MSNYHTHISFQFPCSPEQAAQLDVVLRFDGTQVDELEPYPDILTPIWPNPEALLRDLTGEPSDDNVYLGIDQHSYNDGHYWVASDNPNLTTLAQVIQTVCKPEEPIVFEWATTCNKPRLDAYSGGACVIFADKIVFESTESFIEKCLLEHSLQQAEETAPV